MRIIRILLVFLIIFIQLRFCLAQEDNFEVKGKIEAESITIRGGPCLGGMAFPAAPVKGQMFYCNDEHKYYTFNGTGWKELQGGGPDKRIATKIVAAYNSLDAKEADGTACEVGDTTCNNPKADYTCDGVNDYEEINNAINEVYNSSPKGGAVYLLEGDYYLQSGIVLKSNIALIGQGINTVFRIPMAHSVPLYVIKADNANNILVSNLYIFGQASVGQDNKSIYFSNVNYSQVHNVWIYYVSEGITLSGSNNLVTQNVITGIWVTGKCAIKTTGNNNIFSGNSVIDNTGTGIYIEGSNNIISENIAGLVPDPVFGTTQNEVGIQLKGSNNTISGNNLFYNYQGGISIFSSSANNIISGNNLYYNGCQYSPPGYSCYSDGRNIKVSSSSSFNTISGNVVQGYFWQGIQIDASSGNNTSSGNFIREGGIEIYSDNNTVFNNSISLYSAYRPLIYIASGTGNYIAGNKLSLDVYPAFASGFMEIQDKGTYTKYTDSKKVSLEAAGSCPGSGCTGLVSGGTLTPTRPTSYLVLTPSSSVTLGNPAIAARKSGGDLLILENTSTNGVTINDNAGVQLRDTNGNLIDDDAVTLSSSTADITYGTVKILTFIWDGTYWVEISRMTNP